MRFLHTMIRTGDLNRSIAPEAPTFQTGGDDARVVEHKHIPGAQQVRQVGDAKVIKAVAAHVQQPRLISWLMRPKRDERLGEIEIKVLERQQWRRRRPTQAVLRSAATLAEMIRPGFAGGSPFGSASTAAMPSVTSPQTVY